MKDVILTGFMGTGKSTVGRLLAAQFGLRFVDTDQEIERRAGQTVAEIFAMHGETVFRRVESEVLSDLLQSESDGDIRIIATGGGALLSEHNRVLLENGQRVICLTCSAEEIERRVARNGGRPLLADGEEEDRVRGARIAALLTARAPVYGRFLQVETTGLPPSRVAEEVARAAGLQVAARWSIDVSRSSDLVFSRGALASLSQILRERGIGRDILIVTDRTIDELGFLHHLCAGLEREGFQVHEVILPPGESSKTLDTLQEVYGRCVECRLDRRATIVGLGGGVIGDLAGLVAATYLRGLRLILVPTTLVAQADAAIGGKVAVDFREVKNLIGAFHPAEVVIADPEILRTLPDRRLAEGIAEIVKIAAVRSAGLFAQLEALSGPREILEQSHPIRRAAVEKIRVVEADPYEHGDRALLNFGHTVGHAVEAASHYSLAHGEAVAIGMLAETRLAERNGWCEAGLADRLAEILARFGLPLRAPHLSIAAMLPFAAQDKKRAAGRVRVAVPTHLGEGRVFEADPEDVATALSYVVDGGS